MSQNTTQLDRTAARSLTGFVQNMALHDWLVFGFFAYITLRAMAAPDGEGADKARIFAGILFISATVGILSVRAELLPRGLFRTLFYRVTVFAVLPTSYFLMGILLPALQQPLMDERLLTIDLALFNTTPSVWFEQFNTRPVVEWFALFYYGYFAVMATMFLPMLFFGYGQRLCELMLGAAIVAVLGHTGYTLVPGLGPYAVIDFHAPLNGGYFWGLVQSAVASAGAMLDIFPSLHTAYPTFFALHAFSNRASGFCRYAWPILAFVATNIVIATMFLRWHYGVDVIFGLLLAIIAWQVSTITGRREWQRGQDADDRQPVFDPVLPPIRR
ncbi:MAG: phosphatase PAP2 family protein [Myxococcales bacterium]|nr:phosphatase PAP2 family protein [Myxococcales bacterium]